MLNILLKQRIEKFKYKKYVVLLLVFSASLLSLYTYVTLTRGSSPFGPDMKSVMSLLVVDLIFLLFLVILVAIEIFKIWQNRKTPINNPKLQTRILLIFSLIASVPTIVITIFSTFFFSHGIQSWFNDKINTAFLESVEVARSYSNEHQKLIKLEVTQIAKKIDYMSMLGHPNINYLDNILSNLSNERGYVEAVIFQINPFRIIAQSKFSLTFYLDNLLREAINASLDQNVVIIPEQDRVKALIKLDNFVHDSFLLISRLTDAKVIAHMDKTQAAYNDYQNLNSNISKMQIQFLSIFIFVSLLLVLSAIWTGIILSSAIVRPLLNLLEATERIADGNFGVRVKESKSHDEINILSKAFNSMAEQLNIQHNNLVLANKQIDARRHFSETLISNITAGVIALNKKNIVTMINPSANKILTLEKNIIGKNLLKEWPEIEELMNDIQLHSNKKIKKQIKIVRDNQTKILLVTITTEMLENKLVGYVVTFDDITQLVSAQRSAAWSDVARRIAHEIKNPLTPIHLATQRIQKKFSHEVSDTSNFSKYLDTIEKHVKQIGHIVEEFVYFARIPAPKFIIYDICKIINDTIFARQCLDNNIKYEKNLPDHEILVNCDPEQISQVLTNIIKNSEESLEIYEKENKTITITLTTVQKSVIVVICDNGPGYPTNLLDRLTEPYITSKKTGTGLGLAIVKKIIDDHEAKIEFSNIEDGGAQTKMVFSQTAILESNR